MKILANAKLNLCLRIVGKRDDGYHLLQMINVPVDICDEVEILAEESGHAGLIQSFSPAVDCPMEKTTIYKAYGLLKKNLSRTLAVRVKVNKKIPTGSGMGGGSSDAAVFINYLCKKFNIAVDKGLVDAVSRTVGADVPFFLYNKPAFLEGIGEKVIPFDEFPELSFLVVVPDFSISTAWAYSNAKKILTKSPAHINLKSPKITKQELFALMQNDLEDVARNSYPQIDLIKSALREAGAEKAMMTGSGSAVFGVFTDGTALMRAEKQVRDLFPGYWVHTSKTTGA